MKIVLSVLFVCLSFISFGQKDTTKQFILIVRYNVTAKPTQEDMQTNIKHWNEFMGSLGQAGQIVSGYRPGQEGKSITGKSQTTKDGPYIAENELISSFIIIKARDFAAAEIIAKKCPIYELGGSVEIRSLMQQAN